MTTTRRTLRHACWYAFIGPYIGLLWAIVPWAAGAIPALLTGIAVAFLPTGIHAIHYRRILASATIGLAICAAIPLTGVLLFSDTDLTTFILRGHGFRVIAGSGLFSGLIMGWLIAYLPGREQRKTPNE
ncbi:TPA: hypothetical protein NIU90_002057 [Klebsiella oxytoca]|uniref:hypothetical protein n=1 Tax=Klebsiella oxytoca TaxID=571 RepID=UPI00024FF15B|nr:hypothetical protein [Klebsiella oxytoca]EHS88112.1 hypothetical protein HMPREF9687_05240 [Klebsiella oxytoca 10-5243]EHT9905439.1 hypothetical protein [Klebsiella oxytoca]ELD4400794.1 hypothetical protein [Klebsiella oxytoca]EUC86803.1 inner membrane family protein [Klebsiella oxytoca KA-2]HBM3121434.1 hypothetical protein [Klebsiella oxytoca]